MTPITYEEAAKTLEVSINSLRSAARRGVLTRLPRVGATQPLIEEQVLLFKNKKRLSLFALTVKEKEEWAHYREQATETADTAIDLRGISYSPDFAKQLANEAVKTALEAYQRGEVPQGVPFIALSMPL